MKKKIKAEFWPNEKVFFIEYDRFHSGIIIRTYYEVTQDKQNENLFNINNEIYIKSDCDGDIVVRRPAYISRTLSGLSEKHHEIYFAEMECDLPTFNTP